MNLADIEIKLIAEDRHFLADMQITYHKTLPDLLVSAAEFCIDNMNKNKITRYTNIWYTAKSFYS